MSATSAVRRAQFPEVWLVRATAGLTAGMGLINLLSAATPALADRLALLEAWSPLEVQNGSRLATVLAGFALLLLSVHLGRRKRVAWLLTLFVLAASAASHLLKGLDAEEAGVAAGLAALLLYLRPHFHARSDAPSMRQGVIVLAAAFGFTLLYGAIGFYLLDRHFSVNYDAGPAIRQTVTMFVQFEDPGLEPTTGFGRYFADSIYVVGAVTLGYALLMLVRPVLFRQPATPAERARAAGLVAAHGCSALARFALFDDKAYYFTPGGAVVAYVVKGRAALALGDPIGPAAEWPAAITGFLGFCAGNDWEPAFYQVSPAALSDYRAAGHTALCVGQEALVDLAAFTLEGKAGKEFRTVLNKFAKLGHQVERHPPPLPAGLLGELRAVSDAWLTERRGRELRFATGWFDDDYLRGSPVVTLRAPDGALSGFANAYPLYQAAGWGVDLMRRRPEALSGTMDLLFISLFDWAKAEGLARFSLGLSALAGVGEHSADPAIERALRLLYENLHRVYNFQGLHAFKDKFHPAWEPRYLVYRSPASLPLVAAALVRASSGDDFWLSYFGLGT
ncbi:MAG: bifunctional lysylphosphatidylglycerol flippase/synthetase MprF [Anaerolineales bacterium]|nr:bifunctional lysylphosphatidylglycerol flippase/synthetase MprF [Anaerolineales bacterium]